MEIMYRYLTGPRFRQRLEAIVEKFSDMQEDLERERRSMTRQWAKREEQIRSVIEATAGMYGDLQGIAGRALESIEGIALPLIENKGTEDDFDCRMTIGRGRSRHLGFPFRSSKVNRRVGRQHRGTAVSARLAMVRASPATTVSSGGEGGSASYLVDCQP